MREGLRISQSRFVRSLRPQEWLAAPRDAPHEVWRNGLMMLASSELRTSPRVAVDAATLMFERFPDPVLDPMLVGSFFTETLLAGLPVEEAIERLGAVASTGTPSSRVSAMTGLSLALAVAGRLDDARAVARDAEQLRRTLADDDPVKALSEPQIRLQLDLLGMVVPPRTPALVFPSQRPATQSSAGLRLLAYWEPWCAPCLADMPQLESLARRIEVIGITRGHMPPRGDEKDALETRASRVKAIRRERRARFRMELVDDTFPRAQGVESIPVRLVVDANERVVFALAGSGQDVLMGRAVDILRPRARAPA